MKKEKSDNQNTLAKGDKKRGRPRKSSSKHYIDDVTFKALIVEYYKTDHFSEELGEMIQQLSEHIAYMPNFIKYTFHDTMKSNSNYKMVRALNERKFDPDKGSPFSYFSMICYREFIHVIKNEDKKHSTITRYQAELYDEMLLHGIGNHNSDEDH